MISSGSTLKEGEKIFKSQRLRKSGDFETWQDRCIQETTAAVFACTRPSGEQVSQHPVLNRGEAHQPAPLAEELVTVCDCWGGRESVFRGVLPQWAPHVLLEGPSSIV